VGFLEAMNMALAAAVQVLTEVPADPQAERAQAGAIRPLRRHGPSVPEGEPPPTLTERRSNHPRRFAIAVAAGRS
jgi:hypothetical protein